MDVLRDILFSFFFYSFNLYFKPVEVFNGKRNYVITNLDFYKAFDVQVSSQYNINDEWGDWSESVRSKSYEGKYIKLVFL